MIGKILLITKQPELHAELVQRLETAGSQLVTQLPSLRAAAKTLSDSADSWLALIIDGLPCTELDSGLFAEWKLRRPSMQVMLFTESDCQPQALDRLEDLGVASIFPHPLADAGSYRTIADALRPPALPMVPKKLERFGEMTKGASIPRAENTTGPGGSAIYSEEFLRRVGLSDVPVLLHGETGVGKEVMARHLWTYSSRSNKPFLKLNCAALPSELIESELFGYEKGAFTGATVDKPGKFEMAQNGTIMLDEIGDMDIRLQAKLLQVLQDGEVQPLGSSRIVKVNVRVMAATHRDLHAAIAHGSFREDLYYRLSVINITIPPLRERRDEILPLAEQLLLRHMARGATAPAIPETLRWAMLSHPWPGNVRELENLMRRFLIYQDAALLVAELKESLIPARRRRASDRLTELSRPPISIDTLAEVSRSAESKLMLDTLEAVRWNRRQAALRLDMDYKAFLYKLQKHGIVESKAKRGEVSA